MKSSIKTIALVACVMSSAITWPSQVRAQDNGMVAVLDVAKVFEANSTFTNRMNTIKKEAQDFKKSMEEQQRTLQQQVSKLQGMTQGSPEFNQLQGQLEQQATALRTSAQQTNNDLLIREAKIYLESYNEMQSVIAKLATEYNISLIIRYDSKPIDPQNRPEVIKGVNRNVVFQRNLDLTSLVIKEMSPATSGLETNNK